MCRCGSLGVGGRESKEIGNWARSRSGRLAGFYGFPARRLAGLCFSFLPSRAETERERERGVSWWGKILLPAKLGRQHSTVFHFQYGYSLGKVGKKHTIREWPKGEEHQSRKTRHSKSNYAVFV